MTSPANNNARICFTKNDLRSDFFSESNHAIFSNKSAPMNTHVSPNMHGSQNTLDSRIKRALKNEKLLQLKKGLYMTCNNYIHEPDKVKLAEYLASQIYQPSYLSLEYALKKHGLLSQNTDSAESFDPSINSPYNQYSSLPESFSEPITSITTKPTRTFQNFSGTYLYTNIKPALYIGNNQSNEKHYMSHNDEVIKTENNIYVGYEEYTFHDNTYYIATKAKALFDYFYLKSNLKHRNTKDLRCQLFEESGIRWSNFSEEDFKEFSNYVWNSNSKKMMRVRDVLNNYFENKKFDVWKEELLG